jgi:hypothetical protein
MDSWLTISYSFNNSTLLLGQAEGQAIYDAALGNQFGA